MTDFYAHSREDLPPEQWQKLEEHLQATAELAARFAQKFGTPNWARLAGWLHDLGKTSANFQKRIRAVAANSVIHLRKEPHSTAGALLAVQTFNILGRVLAYLVAGHHAGLPDWLDEQNSDSTLERRLDTSPHWDDSFIEQHIQPHLMPPKEKMPHTNGPLFFSTWVRMLFSCLVDADFLDTEAFMTPEKFRQRGNFRSLQELLPIFEEFMQQKTKASELTPVNQVRREILNACCEKARSAPGIFTLTVPTGGGKTLSSMAFALRHAVQHGKDRIIYVIPYTSIIEQTADVFRGIFGDDVIEHHSNYESPKETDEDSSYKLATENWDAPIIVTTTVQFFESLFASRTSRCRKLHNIVNSVVILDEAQLLPADFLTPILLAIQELKTNYKVSFIISTATQPAFEPQETIFPGLTGMQEIMPDPASLHSRLERVRLHIVRNLEPVSWDDLAGELARHPRVLCIVNKRRDARELWEKMPPGTIHLSALMCGAHRSEKIREIRQRLQEGSPVRVVSTQLVEAGVDVDFPVVYRAVAGLDSIAQAAGRCNREGKNERGDVYVFEPESLPPAGFLRQAAEGGRLLLRKHHENSLDLECFHAYFKELYWMRGDRLDKEGILNLLKTDNSLVVRFRTAAERFRIIDEGAQRPVVVSWGEGAKWIAMLEKAQRPERWLLRKLQRYTVTLPVSVHNQLLREYAIAEVFPGIFVQKKADLYQEDLGLCPDRSGIYEPEELIQ